MSRPLFLKRALTNKSGDEAYILVNPDNISCVYVGKKGKKLKDGTIEPTVCVWLRNGGHLMVESELNNFFDLWSSATSA